MVRWNLFLGRQLCRNPGERALPSNAAGNEAIDPRGMGSFKGSNHASSWLEFYNL